MRKAGAPLILGFILLAAALPALIGQEEEDKPFRIAPNETRNGFGRVLSLNLRSSPFPDPARQAGYSYEGEFYPRIGHYDDPSVAVFIPDGFEPRGSVDLVFFFHGWFSSVSEAARDFELYRQFSRSGAKALLVLPETARDAPDSFGGKLERENGFNALVGELLEELHETGLMPPLHVGKISIFGHSGAYHIISRILGQGGIANKIGEVCLFDALYEDVGIYAGWIQRSGGRFVSISAEGGDPADNSRSLAAYLQGKGIDVETAKDDPKEDALSLMHRVVFLSSSYDHGSLIDQADEFMRVLAAAIPKL
jgi:hypothetical protein